MRPSAVLVEIYVLRPFAIRVGGESMQTAREAQRKPADLLKLLVALGGEDIPETRLIESLWPDSEGDRAHSAFTTTLHRLRKLIGHEALEMRQGRLGLNSSLVWVDCQAFVARLGMAVQAMESTDAATAWSEMEQAIALYRAPFLEGEHEPVDILTARERLHSQFTRHIDWLGEFFSEAGDHAKAVVLYQKGLETAPLAEALYQNLMRCYQRQGRGAEAIATYQRCRQTLRSALGIDPSRETETLHRTLLQEQSRIAPARRISADRHEREAHAGSDLYADSGFAATATPGASSTSDRVPAASAASIGQHVYAGERRKATVLVSHLFGDAATEDKLDPEEMQEIMARIRARVERIVEGHGGIVNQFAGNEVLALFGIPHAHEDDPLRAVRAACQLHGSAQDIGAELHGRIGVPLHLRSGIETGLVVTGQGDPRSGAYRISGEAVNGGARFASRAALEEIVVGAETHRLIADFFDTQALGEVRGDSEAAFRVLGSTAFTTRFEAAERRGYTPFTGRALELATLHACLDRAMAGRGQFVTVVGEAGIGKSRLLHEFRRTLDRQRVTVLEGRCQSYGTVTPYLPLLDALRRGLRLREEDSPATLLGKAVTNIRAIDPALEAYIPHCLHLLSIPSEEFPLPANLRGDALKSALEEALAAVTTLNTRHRPMVEIFEDWHWADEASESALRNLLGLIAQYPLLVVVLSRPEHEANWGSGGHHTPVVLKSLEQADTEAIARASWNATHLPEGLGALIHGRTEGNPFYVEEVCRALAEDGTVLIRGGNVTLTRPLGSVRLPETVQAVIQTRVDRLSEEAGETLRLASVIGREFGRRLLDALHPVPERIAVSLEELKSAELIQQTRILPDADYIFTHVLTQAVVYENLLLQRRRELHRRVGAAIEGIFVGRLDEQYEALAHHYGLSDDTAKALHYLEKAGDKAAQIFSLAEARKHYRGAVALADAPSGDDGTTRHLVDLTLKWATAGYLGGTEGLLEQLNSAMNRAKELGDKIRMGKIALWTGRILYIRGELIAACTSFGQGIELCHESSDPEPIGLLYGMMGRPKLYMAEYEESIRNLERGIGIQEGLQMPGEVAMATGILAANYAAMGNFERGLELHNRAIDNARRAGHRSFEGTCNMMRAFLWIHKGEWKRALDDCDQAREIFAHTADFLMDGITRAARGDALFMLGRGDQGIESLRDGIGALREGGSTVALTIIHGLTAECLALKGSYQEAREHAEHALALGQRGQNHGVPIAHRALGIAAAADDNLDWDEALRHMEESLRVARTQGGRPFEAVTHLRYAELLHKKVERKAALEQLAEAENLFARIDMPWWSEQAAGLRGRIERGERFNWFGPYYVDGPPKV